MADAIIPFSQGRKLADPATIEARLSDLADRIWGVKGVIGAVRDAVSVEDACSDTANALSLVYGLLSDIADEVSDAHKPDYKPEHLVQP